MIGVAWRAYWVALGGFAGIWVLVGLVIAAVARAAPIEGGTATEDEGVTWCVVPCNRQE